MNTTLLELENFVNGLGVKTSRNGENILVNRHDITSLGLTDAEFLTELKNSVNKRIYIAENTMGWLYLGCL